MSAAITELSAARAARPAPDPLFWPAGEPAAGRPLLATPVPAGAPAPADDRVERRLSLDEHLVRAPERTFFARVQGDAWAALGVRDGDLLVVDRAAPPTAGSLAVVAVGGRFALRRLGRDAGGRPRLESADGSPGERAAGDDPPECAGMPPAWGVYVTVDDADAVARRVETLGGKLLRPPQDIPDVGRFCVLQDPQGATLCAMQYLKRS